LSTPLLAVYAIGRELMAEWAARTLSGGVAVVTDPDDVDAQPPGTTWLCEESDVEALRERRPDDPRVTVAPAPPAPWRQLAHDVRGPIGVISGALAELSSDDPIIPLAKRSTERLVHVTECWDAIDAAVDVSERPATELLEGAVADFARLEPRRGEKVRVEPTDVVLRTDPKRLRLGLVRLLAHLTRVGREPLTVCATGPDVIELRGAAETDFSPEGADDRSSRLTLAVALLGPITARWETDGDVLRWHRASS